MGPKSTMPALSTAEPAVLAREEKQAALEKLLSAGAFARSDQLRRFLRFVCEMELAGRSAQITEHRIGVEVLGRPADYSTTEDSIVRRRAKDLRDKLEEVYAGELAGATLRIELPKGRYVPRYVPAGGLPAGAVELPRPPPPATPLLSSRAYWWGVASGAAAVAAALAVMLLRPHSGIPAAAAGAGVVYEAESAANTLGGSTAVGECPACSGGARVRNLGNGPANAVLIDGVTVGAAGRYSIAIDYLLHGSRMLFVSVNDGAGIELPLTGESWHAPARVWLVVSLDAGRNRLKLYNDGAAAPDLDCITVR